MQEFLHVRIPCRAYPDWDEEKCAFHEYRINITDHHVLRLYLEMQNQGELAAGRIRQPLQALGTAASAAMRAAHLAFELLPILRLELEQLPADPNANRKTRPLILSAVIGGRR